RSVGPAYSTLFPYATLFRSTEFDGCDPIESYYEISKAVASIRAGNGPALVHAHVVRPYSHSMSDDERNYRPEHELDADAARDPRSEEHTSELQSRENLVCRL